MKKIIVSLLIFVFMIFSITPAFAADDIFTFEYSEWQESTGDGYVTLQYFSEKLTLKDNEEIAEVPKGADVKITIKADMGSEITAVSYNGQPMSYERPATELNLTIDNYSGNNSLKVTYDKATYPCSVKYEGKGKVTITSPVTEGSSVLLPVGEAFAFTIEADAKEEIVSVSINGEMVDLSRYGKNETNKISKFSMELPDIREATEVFVLFSGGGNIRYGDVNNDTRVNVMDATRIQKNVAGMISFDSVQKLAADVDADAKVSVKDATTVQKWVAGLIEVFPAEKK